MARAPTQLYFCFYQFGTTDATDYMTFPAVSQRYMPLVGGAQPLPTPRDPSLVTLGCYRLPPNVYTFIFRGAGPVKAGVAVSRDSGLVTAGYASVLLSPSQNCHRMYILLFFGMPASIQPGWQYHGIPASSQLGTHQFS